MSQLSKARIRERSRRELSSLIDDDFIVALRQAEERLPKQRVDACFAWLIRRLWLSHGDVLPADLKRKYLALRAEISWLEDGITVQNELSQPGLRELAGLVVEFHTRHRHLAGLSTKEAKP